MQIEPKIEKLSESAKLFHCRKLNFFMVFGEKKWLHLQLQIKKKTSS